MIIFEVIGICVLIGVSSIVIIDTYQTHKKIKKFKKLIARIEKEKVNKTAFPFT